MGGIFGNLIGTSIWSLLSHNYFCFTSDNAVEFLTQLGFRLDYEFAAKGLIFRKGRMKITVSKIFKIVPPDPFPGAPQPSPGSGVVVQE